MSPDLRHVSAPGQSQMSAYTGLLLGLKCMTLAALVRGSDSADLGRPECLWQPSSQAEIADCAIAQQGSSISALSL